MHLGKEGGLRRWEESCSVRMGEDPIQFPGNKSVIISFVAPSVKMAIIFGVVHLGFKTTAIKVLHIRWPRRIPLLFHGETEPH